MSVLPTVPPADGEALEVLSAELDGRTGRIPARLVASHAGGDFARSSLGLCKHLWWLLEQGFDKKGQANAEVLPTERLWWDPVRPLTQGELG